MGVHSLDLFSVEELIAQTAMGEGKTLDLSNFEFADIYGILMLTLLIKHLSLEGGPPLVTLPRSEDVVGYLERVNFFQEVEQFCTFREDVQHLRCRKRNPLRSLVELTPIGDEGGVTPVVDSLCGILEDQFGLDRKVVNKLGSVMIETFQNIPQHSNPMGERSSLPGLAALQRYRHHVYLAVGDLGIGVRSSLSLSPRYRPSQLTDHEAIMEVLEKGASRFSDVGRGGGLQRVAQITGQLNGIFSLRSGSTLVAVKGRQTRPRALGDLPGTQLGIRIPAFRP